MLVGSVHPCACVHLSSQVYAMVSWKNAILHIAALVLADLGFSVIVDWLAVTGAQGACRCGTLQWSAVFFFG